MPTTSPYSPYAHRLLTEIVEKGKHPVVLKDFADLPEIERDEDDAGGPVHFWQACGILNEMCNLKPHGREGRFVLRMENGEYVVDMLSDDNGAVSNYAMPIASVTEQ